MISGIKDQSVIGKDDPFGISDTADIVDIAFIVDASPFCREDLLRISEDIAADAAAFTDYMQILFGSYPTHFFSFTLGNVI